MVMEGDQVLTATLSVQVLHRDRVIQLICFATVLLAKATSLLDVAFNEKRALQCLPKAFGQTKHQLVRNQQSKHKTGYEVTAESNQHGELESSQSLRGLITVSLSMSS